MTIHCKIYFVFYIFVVCANHENIFTTKISRSTVCQMIVVTGMRWTCVGGVSFMFPLPSPTQRRHFNREAAKKDITMVCEYISACSEEHVTYRPYVNDVTCYISGCYVISCGHLEWQRAVVNCTV